jgi:hypothetical protein
MCRDRKKLPFFLYSYIDNDIVVGRGRGGGLAIWTRADKVQPLASQLPSQTCFDLCRTVLVQPSWSKVSLADSMLPACYHGIDAAWHKLELFRDPVYIQPVLTC